MKDVVWCTGNRRTLADNHGSADYTGERIPFEKGRIVRVEGGGHFEQESV
jgi:hypothetical protein